MFNVWLAFIARVEICKSFHCNRRGAHQHHRRAHSQSVPSVSFAISDTSAVPPQARDGHFHISDAECAAPKINMDGGALTPLGLAQVVGISVLKVMSAGLASAITYRRALKSKQIEKTLLKQISFINRDLLLPFFIFSRCSSGITVDLLYMLWPVPILIVCQLAVGFLVGGVAALLSSAPRETVWPVMLTVCTFSNVIGMPLPLVMSIIAGVPSLRDARDAQSRGMSYLFLCNVMASMLMWGGAGKMLSSRLGCGARRDADAGSTLVMARAIRSEVVPTVELAVSGSNEVRSSVAAAAAASSPQGFAAPCLAFMGSLGTPVYASLLGVCFGTISPLRQLLVESDAPLHWAFETMELLGAGGIPLVLFILGSNLSSGPTNAGVMPTRCTCAIVLAKLFVVPFCNLGLLLIALRIGFLQTDAEGLLPLVVLIVGSSPTAMNVNTIATMQGTGQQEVASCMFWIYALSPFSISIVAYIGLLLFVNVSAG